MPAKKNSSANKRPVRNAGSSRGATAERTSKMRAFGQQNWYEIGYRPSKYQNPGVTRATQGYTTRGRDR